MYLSDTGWIGYHFEQMGITKYFFGTRKEGIIFGLTNGYHQVDMAIAPFLSQIKLFVGFGILSWDARMIGYHHFWPDKWADKNCTISQSDSAQVSLQLRSDSDAVAIVSLSLIVLSLICLYL